MHSTLARQDRFCLHHCSRNLITNLLAWRLRFEIKRFLLQTRYNWSISLLQLSEAGFAPCVLISFKHSFSFRWNSESQPLLVLIVKVFVATVNTFPWQLANDSLICPSWQSKSLCRGMGNTSGHCRLLRRVQYNRVKMSTRRVQITTGQVIPWLQSQGKPNSQQYAYDSQLSRAYPKPSPAY